MKSGASFLLVVTAKIEAHLVRTQRRREGQFPQRKGAQRIACPTLSVHRTFICLTFRPAEQPVKVYSLASWPKSAPLPS
jgi:hypothetical protein